MEIVCPYCGETIVISVDEGEDGELVASAARSDD